MFTKAVLAIVGIAAIILREVYVKIKRAKEPKEMDYSLGSQNVRNTKIYLQNKDYNRVETHISSLKADELSQTVDYIALSFSEDDLSKWLANSKNTDIPNLFLGVYYDFQGWKVRSHETANKVSNRQFADFHTYQEKAMEQFYNVSESGDFIAETHNRLIRVCKALGRTESAAEHFQKAIAIDQNLLAAYLNYAEMIQPKWGGNNQLIDDLLKQLPDNQLIKQTVQLKLTWDALLMNENYFGGTVEELKQIAKETISKIHKSISLNEPKSIQKYIAFNYLFFIAHEFNNEKLTAEYFNKVEGFPVIYTHGVAI